jgi:hypothetical protein
VIIVARYGGNNPKAVILHPGDYARLTPDAAFVDAAAAIGDHNEGSVAARELEDRPDDETWSKIAKQLVRLLDL